MNVNVLDNEIYVFVILNNLERFVVLNTQFKLNITVIGSFTGFYLLSINTMMILVNRNTCQ